MPAFFMVSVKYTLEDFLMLLLTNVSFRFSLLYEIHEMLAHRTHRTEDYHNLTSLQYFLLA